MRRAEGLGKKGLNFWDPMATFLLRICNSIVPTNRNARIQSQLTIMRRPLQFSSFLLSNPRTIAALHRRR
jgi:hypothetical protein